MAEKTIKEGFMYPFNNWKRLFNFWWVLTIIGVFAVIGYFRKIVQQFLKKDYKELPEFGDFWENTKQGFFFFLVMLAPAIIVSIVTGYMGEILGKTFFGGIIYFVLAIYIDMFLALLFINYLKKEVYSNVFDLKKVWAIMSKDWKDTTMTILKTTAIMIGFAIASIPVITLVVTLPAMSFAGYYFIADFYNRRA